MFEHLSFDKCDGVATITLRRGRLNILTRDMHREFYAALQCFLRDDTLKVAILTSAQGQSFSAGDDLATVDDPLGTEPDWAELVMLANREKPIIGAVRGYCLGQGLLYLLLLTEIRLATPDAQFGFPEIKYGMGGASGAARLARQLPPTVAMHLALTGEFMPAHEAHRTFLVNEVVADEVLLARATELASKIAEHPVAALRAEMQAFEASSTMAKLDAVQHAGRLYDWQRNVLGPAVAYEHGHANGAAKR